MKPPKPILFPARYEAALRQYLKTGRANPPLDWGALSRSAGFKTHNLAALHEKILISQILPACPRKNRTKLLQKAAAFFSMALVPATDENTHATPRSPASRFHLSLSALSQHSLQLASQNEDMRMDIDRLTVKAATLRKRERHFAESLRESDLLKEQLRRLSRRIFVVQEEERKKISRELHDVIAQALVGINIRLNSLKREASLDTKGLHRNISITQRLVQESATIVHDFARELRPAVLDDLGLVPALRTYLQSFGERTGLATHMSAYDGFGQLDPSQRTVFFRVAQEALTNIARHAHASRVEIRFSKKKNTNICMTVRDDGKAFDAKRVMLGRGDKRLGLLGMRERLEMVGGIFLIESTPGHGTTLTAQLPSQSSNSKKTQKSP